MNNTCTLATMLATSAGDDGETLNEHNFPLNASGRVLQRCWKDCGVKLNSAGPAVGPHALRYREGLVGDDAPNNPVSPDISKKSIDTFLGAVTEVAPCPTSPEEFSCCGFVKCEISPVVACCRKRSGISHNHKNKYCNSLYH